MSQFAWVASEAGLKSSIPLCLHFLNEINFVLIPSSLLGSFICCSAILELLFSPLHKLQYRHCQIKKKSCIITSN